MKGFCDNGESFNMNGNFTCSKCPKNTYSNGGGKRRVGCIPCDTGYDTDEQDGQSECKSKKIDIVHSKHATKAHQIKLYRIYHAIYKLMVTAMSVRIKTHLT